MLVIVIATAVADVTAAVAWGPDGGPGGSRGALGVVGSRPLVLLLLLWGGPVVRGAPVLRGALVLRGPPAHRRLGVPLVGGRVVERVGGVGGLW